VQIPTFIFSLNLGLNGRGKGRIFFNSLGKATFFLAFDIEKAIDDLLSGA
jgi:hypothetical protein